MKTGCCPTVFDKDQEPAVELLYRRSRCACRRPPMGDHSLARYQPRQRRARVTVERGMVAMKSWQRYAGLFFLAVSALVIQQSVWVLRLLDHGQPGSGFMPFGLGVILGILALCIIATNLGPEERQVPFWEPKAWLRPLL